MSLTRARTEELVGSKENVPSRESEQGKITTHLQAQTKELQNGIAELKAERGRIESLLRNKTEELRIASEDVGAKQASCEALEKELISLHTVVESRKVELEELREKSTVEEEQIFASRKSLQDDVAHLDRFVEQLTQGISHIDLCSPQRSLARILATSHNHEVVYQEEVRSEPVAFFGLEVGLQINLQSSMLTLQEKFRELEIQLNSRSGGNENVSKDLEIDELGQQLDYAERQVQLSERNKSLSDAQVLALQERVCVLEDDLMLAKKENNECVVFSEERIAGLVKSLESTTYDEKDARQNYEILSDSMSRETVKSGELQKEIRALRQSNLELQSTLNERTEQLAAQRAECTDLQSRIKIIDSENRASQTDIMAPQPLITAAPSPKAANLPYDEPTQAKATLAILTQIASGYDIDLHESPQNNDNNVSYQPDYAKTTNQLTSALHLVDAGICTADGTSTSCCSSAGTEFRPPLPSESKSETKLTLVPSKRDTKLAQGGSMSNKVDSVQITNLSLVGDQKQCACSSSFFAQAEYVEFYLPQITVECTCGKLPPRPVEEELDPCALTSILRPWQTEFLAHEGITDSVGFVHACGNRGDALAAALRRWRRQKGLRKIRTKSCGVAIHIWERTCRKVLRSVTKQKAQGILVPKKPEFLELNITDNTTAVSSLGGGPFRAAVK
jgi:hypothetical protein